MCHCRFRRSSPSDTACKLGDELRIPGLPPGSAHLGWTFPEFDRVKGINDGYVLLAPSADIAANMLGSPGYATAAFVLPRRGVDVTADVDRVIAGVATAGPPRPHLPAVLENGSQSFNLIALAGILVGILIAVNTILLAVEDRRAVMGTIGAIGAKPIGLFGGMLGEGAVVGVLGGLLGRAERFPARDVSGGQLRADPCWPAPAAPSLRTSRRSLIVIGAAAGIICGVLAMIGPAARLVRDGPLASMASVGGVQRARKIPIVAAGGRGGPAGGRRRRAEDIRARVAAAQRGHQQHDGGVVRGGVGDGVDRPAWRRAADRRC